MDKKQVGLSQLLNVTRFGIEVTGVLGRRDYVDHINLIAANPFYDIVKERSAGDYLKL
jgi:hypothetical protein